MARLTNKAGANENGSPTWAERRRRDTYTDTHDSDDSDADDETSDE